MATAYIRRRALAVLIVAVVWSPFLVAENECVACHKSADFYARYPKLYRYFQEWEASPHGQAGVTCDDCHGGDPAAAAMEEAHEGVMIMTDKRSTLYNQTEPETCGRCHKDKQAQFIQSKHYAALMDDRAAPTCTTCHPAMNRRPDYRFIVLNACRTCHAEGNQDNLPLIADQAEHAFHQLNIAKGFLGWTRLHFESQGWPNTSREQTAELERRYETIVNGVHRFDIQETDDQAAQLLGELRETFEKARQSQPPKGTD